MEENRNLEPTEEQIRERAYAIYVARGGEGGQELEDWLTAERELMDAYQQPAAHKARAATAS